MEGEVADNHWFISLLRLIGEVGWRGEVVDNHWFISLLSGLGRLGGGGRLPTIIGLVIEMDWGGGVEGNNH